MDNNDLLLTSRVTYFGKPLQYWGIYLILLAPLRT